MIVKGLRAKIKDQEVSNFEKKLKVNLPEEYKRFLLENNGGIPSPSAFEFLDVDGQKSDSLVHYFYAIHDKNEYDNLEQNYLFLTSEERIPQKILPIANDPFGNMICISVSGDDYGKVYFWDHELETEYSECINLCLIANSFNEFINGLQKLNKYGG